MMQRCTMSNDSLTSILIAAQARRDAGQWEHAARLFRRAEMLAPAAANIKHNLAMVYFAKGETNDAQSWAERAIAIDPSLWQSHALLARLSRAAGDAEGAEAAWREVLQHSLGNPTALLGLADLAMNEFGDPEEAIALVSPLRENAGFAVDAELTTLMASLYLGGDARIISDRLTAFSRSNMRLPLRAPGVLRSGRRRIGLISPLFSASPVYYLTYSAWVAVAQHHDLIFFNRGLRRDWATDCFRSLASDWVDVANVDAAPLAQRIADAEIDVLFDLGGWADVIGLTALSTKPASRMYKWVGGRLDWRRLAITARFAAAIRRADHQHRRRLCRLHAAQRACHVDQSAALGSGVGRQSGEDRAGNIGCVAERGR
jgi:tetratricopeptide (TPR) repeat protein